MKHKLIDDVNVNVNIELPVQALETLIVNIGNVAIVTIGFYMITDTSRHFLKTLIK